MTMPTFPADVLERAARIRLIGFDVDGTLTDGGLQFDADALAVEAAQLMEAHQINALLVTSGDGRLVGALNIHDLLRARVV